jgi:hypothetical protein
MTRLYFKLLTRKNICKYKNQTINRSSVSDFMYTCSFLYPFMQLCHDCQQNFILYRVWTAYSSTVSHHNGHLELMPSWFSWFNVYGLCHIISTWRKQWFVKATSYFQRIYITVYLSYGCLQIIHGIKAICNLHLKNQYYLQTSRTFSVLLIYQIIITTANFKAFLLYSKMFQNYYGT